MEGPRMLKSIRLNSMRHRKTTKTLDRNTAARRALLRGLAESMILHEKIRTTKAKAKAVRALVERSIHMSKRGDLTARRHLLSTLYSETAVKKALEVIGPRYKNREGGYTRMVSVGPRQGDGAEMVQMELV